jgi:hypothetical protein
MESIKVESGLRLQNWERAKEQISELTAAHFTQLNRAQEQISELAQAQSTHVAELERAKLAAAESQKDLLAAQGLNTELGTDLVSARADLASASAALAQAWSDLDAERTKEQDSDELSSAKAMIEKLNRELTLARDGLVAAEHATNVQVNLRLAAQAKALKVQSAQRCADFEAAIPSQESVFEIYKDVEAKYVEMENKASWLEAQLGRFENQTLLRHLCYLEGRLALEGRPAPSGDSSTQQPMDINNPHQAELVALRERINELQGSIRRQCDAMRDLEAQAKADANTITAVEDELQAEKAKVNETLKNHGSLHRAYQKVLDAHAHCGEEHLLPDTSEITALQEQVASLQESLHNVEEECRNLEQQLRGAKADLSGTWIALAQCEEQYKQADSQFRLEAEQLRALKDSTDITIAHRDRQLSIADEHLDEAEAATTDAISRLDQANHLLDLRHRELEDATGQLQVLANERTTLTGSLEETSKALDNEKALHVLYSKALSAVSNSSEAHQLLAVLAREETSRRAERYAASIGDEGGVAQQLRNRCANLEATCVRQQQEAQAAANRFRTTIQELQVRLRNADNARLPQVSQRLMRVVHAHSWHQSTGSLPGPSFPRRPPPTRSPQAPPAIVTPAAVPLTGTPNLAELVAPAPDISLAAHATRPTPAFVSSTSPTAAASSGVLAASSPAVQPTVSVDAEASRPYARTSLYTRPRPMTPAQSTDRAIHGLKKQVRPCL